MKLGTTYKCDLCGKQFTMSYDKPDHISIMRYDPTASTRSNTTAEYDLCQECACAIQRVINERDKNQ